MKKLSTHEIALSAIACAFATLCLTVGTLYTPLLFTGYLFACLALMIPISEGHILGDCLAYIASCILALLFNGFNIFDTLPFIIFFGLHPIVNALQKRFKIRKWIAIPVKAAWFDICMWLTWKFTFDMNTEIPFVDKYIVLIIATIGTLFFIFYDYVVIRAQYTVNYAVKKWIKRK